MFRWKSQKVSPGRRLLFDPAWYGRRHGLVGEDAAWQHFCAHRGTHGLEPNPLFDSRWYRAAYSVSASLDALDHFLIANPKDTRSPSPFFDSRWYLETNADVRGAGLDPYRHYIEWGRHEGRLPNPWSDPAYTGECAFDLDVPATYGVDDLLGYIPHYTTLDRLVSGAEAGSFFFPGTPFWIFAKVAVPDERPAPGTDAVLLGGSGEQFSGVNVCLSDEDGTRTGHYRAFQVRYAVSPMIRNAVTALGRDPGSSGCLADLKDRIARAVGRRPDVPPSEINLLVDTIAAPAMRRYLADGPFVEIRIVTMDPGYLCRAQLL